MKVEMRCTRSSKAAFVGRDLTATTGSRYLYEGSRKFQVTLRDYIDGGSVAVGKRYCSTSGDSEFTVTKLIAVDCQQPASKAAGMPAAYPPVLAGNPANPKQAFGDKKPPVHLIHTIAELHESAALHSGGRKYGFNNYIAAPVEAMTYVGAIKRHLGQWASGERVDAKELVHHLGAIKACCTILLTAEATGMLIDNRPKVGGGQATCPATPATNVLASATAQTFKEVEGIIDHLNHLYPAKL